MGSFLSCIRSHKLSSEVELECESDVLFTNEYLDSNHLRHLDDEKKLSLDEGISHATPKTVERPTTSVFANTALKDPQNIYDVFLSFRGEDTRYNSFLSCIHSPEYPYGLESLDSDLQSEYSESNRLRHLHDEKLSQYQEEGISHTTPKTIERPTTSVSSNTSPKNHQNIYDVFLSFRGEDTRYNFTSHLYTALGNRGINTFIDDKLRQGEELAPALVRAIESSRIAIVIFSENYANSSWCLDELLKILECNEAKGQIVVPVFYKVDPSEVRKQTGKFAEALSRHEDRMQNPPKLKMWKEALRKAANFSGWHLTAHDNEAKVIQDIVKQVIPNLDSELLHVSDDLVGMEAHLKVLSPLMDVGSDEDDVTMIGICGMGGIGKTTIAKAIYNSFKAKFEFDEFLADVRETCEKNSQNGLLQLQKTLLSRLISDDELKLTNVDRGMNAIKRRLCNKRVLVVIDDVNHLKQLETLAGACDWFGRGSRIIITTRDEHLLVAHGVKKVYNVQVLKDYDALCLFCRKAFKTSVPEKRYSEFSRQVIRYASGLPLAVKVLGSFFSGRNPSEWISAMEMLRKIPNNEIYGVLEISFLGLNDNEKTIFLDIACFFKGKPVDYVAKVLKSFDLHPEIGMRVLEEKSLITTKSGVVKIHDMIEEMGKEIVRRESPEDPSGRTRLWFHEDVLDVLSENTETSKIQGIKLELAASERAQVCFSDDVLTNMKRLRLFIARNVVPSDDDSLCFPNGLRWLEWPRCTLPSLPFGSGQKKLVGLYMSKSNIRLLGEELKPFRSLKFVDFSHSTFLSKLPDVSSLQNLESLDLSECKSLIEVHDSLGLLEKITFLNFLNCCKLSSFPSSLRSKALQSLILEGCSELSVFPDILVEVKGMTELSMDETAISELPHSIGNLTALVRLNMSKSSIRELGDELKLFRMLRFADFSHSTFLSKLPDVSSLQNLESLDLSECESLIEVHDSLGFLQKLIHLNLLNCCNLCSFPSSLSSKSLQSLILKGCSKLSRFPDMLVEVEGMTELSLDDTAIEELPDSIGNFTGLIGFSLKYCKKLKSLPSSIYKVQGLEYLDLSGCSQFEKFPDLGEGSSAHTAILPSSAFPNLIYFDLRGCHLSEVNFLEDLQCVSTLIVLNLSENKFLCLPKGISRFTKLQQLNLTNCRQLQAIPELPPNISHLFAEGCESLESYASLSNMLQAPHNQSSLMKRIELLGCDKLNQWSDTTIDRMLSIEELLGNARVDIFHPGSEVPTWFLYRSTKERPRNHITEGPESQVPKWFYLHSTERLLRFEVPSNLYPTVTGLAFCGVATSGKTTKISFEIQLFVNKERTYGFVEHFPVQKSDHLWLSYIPRNLMWGLDAKLTHECSRFAVLFKISGAVLGSCGVHLVQTPHLYEEFKQDSPNFKKKRRHF